MAGLLDGFGTMGPEVVTQTSINRNHLFAGLCVVGFANGIVFRVLKQIREQELASVLMNTFDISAIVWIALAVGVVFVCRPPLVRLTRLDGALAAGAGVAFIVPLAPLSWIAVSGLALRIIRSSTPGTYPHRGAWILLAMTIPMFWSRALFSVLSDQILAFDAVLVGWIGATARAGNTVAFADGSGYLWIAPACSSLANVSLAILCWILITQLVYRKRPLGKLWWAVAACAAVTTINVIRLSLISRYSQAFDILHGPIGTTIANWLALTAIVGICVLGVRHDFNASRRNLPRDHAYRQSSL